MNNTIIYHLSQRSDGPMKKNKRPDKENLGKFFKKNNLRLEDAFFMKQVHGNGIVEVDNESEHYIENIDGMVTKERNKTLAIFTADCVPVVMYDNKNNCIGAAHAGYKGILLGVVENLLEKMKEIGAETENIQVFIGPSIRGCCYDVPQERVEQFEKKYPTFKNMYTKKNRNLLLQLDHIVTQIALQNGIKQSNITTDPDCTGCSEKKYFSYRKESKETYGEFITTITNI